MSLVLHCVLYSEIEEQEIIQSVKNMIYIILVFCSCPYGGTSKAMFTFQAEVSQIQFYTLSIYTRDTSDLF